MFNKTENKYDWFIMELNGVNMDESISDMIAKQLTDTDLNNLCYFFNELLELGFAMQWKLHEEAEHSGSKNLEIFEEGCDNLLKKYHRGFLDLKKKYRWDSNIGEELE